MAVNNKVKELVGMIGNDSEGYYDGKYLNEYKEIAHIMELEGEIRLAKDGEGHFIIVDDGYNYDYIYNNGGLLDIDDILNNYSDDITGWGYSDEYSICDKCGEIVRTSPDSYNWTADYYIDYEAGELICGKCLELEDILPTYINNPDKAITQFTPDDLTAEGFELLESHDFGLYGFEDNTAPSTTYFKLRDFYEEIIFVITSSSQFGQSYDVMTRGKYEIEEDEK